MVYPFTSFSLVWYVFRAEVPCSHLGGGQEVFNRGSEARVRVHGRSPIEWLWPGCSP